MCVSGSARDQAGLLRAVVLKTNIGSRLPGSSRIAMTARWTWQAFPVASDWTFRSRRSIRQPRELDVQSWVAWVAPASVPCLSQAWLGPSTHDHGLGMGRAGHPRPRLWATSQASQARAGARVPQQPGLRPPEENRGGVPAEQSVDADTSPVCCVPALRGPTIVLACGFGVILASVSSPDGYVLGGRGRGGGHPGGSRRPPRGIRKTSSPSSTCPGAGAFLPPPVPHPRVSAAP